MRLAMLKGLLIMLLRFHWPQAAAATASGTCLLRDGVVSRFLKSCSDSDFPSSRSNLLNILVHCVGDTRARQRLRVLVQDPTICDDAVRHAKLFPADSTITCYHPPTSPAPAVANAVAGDGLLTVPTNLEASFPGNGDGTMYDVWFGAAEELGEAAEMGSLLDLSSLVALDSLLDWHGMGSSLAMAATYGGRVLALPLRSSPLMLLYRRDLLDRVGGRVPRTWGELLLAARALNGSDLNADGEPDVGLCARWYVGCPGGITPFANALLAPYLQADSFIRGIHFNVGARSTSCSPAVADFAATLEPLWDTPATAEALDLLLQLRRVSLDPTTGPQAATQGGTRDGGQPPDVCHDPVTRPFLQGRCAFSLSTFADFKAASHASAAPNAVRGRMGASVLPGATRVLLRPPDVRSTPSCWAVGQAGGQLQGQFVNCTQTVCPFAEETTEDELGVVRPVNRAPYVPVDIVAVNDQSSQGALDSLLAYYLASQLAAPLDRQNALLDPSTYVSPTRLSDLDPQLWAAAGYDADDAAAVLSAYKATLQHPNAVHPLRMKGQATYTRIFAALLDSIVAADGGNLTGILAAANAALFAAFNATQEPSLVASYQRSLDQTLETTNVHPTTRTSPRASADRVSQEDGGGGVILPAWGISLLTAVGVLLVALALAFLFRRCQAMSFKRYKARRAPGPGPDTTLLLSDIADSTMLWEVLPADVMDYSVRLHSMAIRHLLVRHHGYESATEGDAFIMAFDHPQAALAFACDLQVVLLKLDWPEDLLVRPEAAPAYVVPAASLARGSSRHRWRANGSSRGGGSSRQPSELWLGPEATWPSAGHLSNPLASLHSHRDGDNTDGSVSGFAEEADRGGDDSTGHIGNMRYMPYLPYRLDRCPSGVSGLHRSTSGDRGFKSRGLHDALAEHSSWRCVGQGMAEAVNAPAHPNHDSSGPACSLGNGRRGSDAGSPYARRFFKSLPIINVDLAAAEAGAAEAVSSGGDDGSDALAVARPTPAAVVQEWGSAAATAAGADTQLVHSPPPALMLSPLPLSSHGTTDKLQLELRSRALRPDGGGGSSGGLAAVSVSLSGVRHPGAAASRSRLASMASADGRALECVLDGWAGVMQPSPSTAAVPHVAATAAMGAAVAAAASGATVAAAVALGRGAGRRRASRIAVAEPSPQPGASDASGAASGTDPGCGAAASGVVTMTSSGRETDSDVDAVQLLNSRQQPQLQPQQQSLRPHGPCRRERPSPLFNAQRSGAEHSVRFSPSALKQRFNPGLSGPEKGLKLPPQPEAHGSGLAGAAPSDRQFTQEPRGPAGLTWLSILRAAPEVFLTAACDRGGSAAVSEGPLVVCDIAPSSARRSVTAVDLPASEPMKAASTHGTSVDLHATSSVAVPSASQAQRIPRATQGHQSVPRTALQLSYDRFIAVEGGQLLRPLAPLAPAPHQTLQPSRLVPPQAMGPGISEIEPDTAAATSIAFSIGSSECRRETGALVVASHAAIPEIQLPYSASGDTIAPSSMSPGLLMPYAVLSRSRSASVRRGGTAAQGSSDFLRRLYGKSFDASTSCETTAGGSLAVQDDALDGYTDVLTAADRAPVLAHTRSLRGGPARRSRGRSRPELLAAGNDTVSYVSYMKQLWQEADSNQPDAMLIYRGLRLRLGFHTGLASASDLQMNSATGRRAYSGLFLAVAREVCNAGPGGCVMMSESARWRLMSLGAFKYTSSLGCIYMGHYAGTSYINESLPSCAMTYDGSVVTTATGVNTASIYGMCSNQCDSHNGSFFTPAVKDSATVLGFGRVNPIPTELPDPLQSPGPGLALYQLTGGPAELFTARLVLQPPLSRCGPCRLLGSPAAPLWSSSLAVAEVQVQGVGAILAWNFEVGREALHLCLSTMKRLAVLRSSSWPGNHGGAGGAGAGGGAASRTSGDGGSGGGARGGGTGLRSSIYLSYEDGRMAGEKDRNKGVRCSACGVGGGGRGGKGGGSGGKEGGGGGGGGGGFLATGRMVAVCEEVASLVAWAAELQAAMIRLPWSDELLQHECCAELSVRRSVIPQSTATQAGVKGSSVTTAGAAEPPPAPSTPSMLASSCARSGAGALSGAKARLGLQPPSARLRSATLALSPQARAKWVPSSASSSAAPPMAAFADLAGSLGASGISRNSVVPSSGEVSCRSPLPSASPRISLDMYSSCGAGAVAGTGTVRGTMCLPAPAAVTLTAAVVAAAHGSDQSLPIRIPCPPPAASKRHFLEDEEALMAAAAVAPPPQPLSSGPAATKAVNSGVASRNEHDTIHLSAAVETVAGVETRTEAEDWPSGMLRVSSWVSNTGGGGSGHIDGNGDGSIVRHRCCHRPSEEWPTLEFPKQGWAKPAPAGGQLGAEAYGPAVVDLKKVSLGDEVEGRSETAWLPASTVVTADAAPVMPCTAPLGAEPTAPSGTPLTPLPPAPSQSAGASPETWIASSASGSRFLAAHSVTPPVQQSIRRTLDSINEAGFCQQNIMLASAARYGRQAAANDFAGTAGRQIAAAVGAAAISGPPPEAHTMGTTGAASTRSRPGSATSLSQSASTCKVATAAPDGDSRGGVGSSVGGGTGGCGMYFFGRDSAGGPLCRVVSGFAAASAGAPPAATVTAAAAAAESPSELVVLLRGLRLRIGVDVGGVRGTLSKTSGRIMYRGRAVQRAGRMAALARAGQVVCALETVEAIGAAPAAAAAAAVAADAEAEAEVAAASRAPVAPVGALPAAGAPPLFWGAETRIPVTGAQRAFARRSCGPVITAEADAGTASKLPRHQAAQQQLLEPPSRGDSVTAGTGRSLRLLPPTPPASLPSSRGQSMSQPFAPARSSLLASTLLQLARSSRNAESSRHPSLIARKAGRAGSEQPLEDVVEMSYYSYVMGGTVRLRFMQINSPGKRNGIYLLTWQEFQSQEQHVCRRHLQHRQLPSEGPLHKATGGLGGGGGPGIPGGPSDGASRDCNPMVGAISPAMSTFPTLYE